TNNAHNEPNAEGKPHHTTARKQFEIIVMRFLRRESAGRVVIRSDGNPITAESRSEDRMGRKEFQRRAPDLISARAFSRRVCDDCAYAAGLVEVSHESIAAEPKSPQQNTGHERNHQRRAQRESFR